MSKNNQTGATHFKTQTFEPWEVTHLRHNVGDGVGKKGDRFIFIRLLPKHAPYATQYATMLDKRGLHCLNVRYFERPIHNSTEPTT
jgi:hypothetical protein